VNESPMGPVSELSVLYALPIPRFYSQCGGVGGHIAHAHGVMKSLMNLGANLDVLAAEKPAGPLEFEGNWHLLPCRNTRPPGRYFWGRNFVDMVANLVSRSDYSFCYMRYSTQFSPLIPSLKKALGKAALVLELNSFGSQHGVLGRTFLSAMEKNALKAADLVLCISDHLLNDVTRLLGSEVADRCFVVPNGVDPDRFLCANERQSAAGDTVNLCYCGVLKSGNGLETLLEAHKKLETEHSALTLHVIGEGPHRSALENSPQRGGNVVFHGAVGFHDVPSKLAEMDILVYTTSKDNAFQSPIKLYEYMCTGRPIVAADTPQTHELLEGEPACGLLFEMGDASQLAAALKRLLSEPALAASMARYARETAVENHNWNQRVVSLLGELENRRILGV